MSELPEKIWIEPDGGEHLLYLTDDLVWTGYLTEYVRSDINARPDVAPDVAGLVEALECISKKSHDALKMTDNRAGRAKDEIMCGYAEHIIQMCDAALAAYRKGGSDNE